MLIPSNFTYNVSSTRTKCYLIGCCLGLQEAAAADESDEEDEFIYNPLKLPLGWDGKPIPYWLYKLHGLNLEFKCEICGELAAGSEMFDCREWSKQVLASPGNNRKQTRSIPSLMYVRCMFDKSKHFQPTNARFGWPRCLAGLPVTFAPCKSGPGLHERSDIPPCLRRWCLLLGPPRV